MGNDLAPVQSEEVKELDSNEATALMEDVDRLNNINPLLQPQGHPISTEDHFSQFRKKFFEKEITLEEAQELSNSFTVEGLALIFRNTNIEEAMKAIISSGAQPLACGKEFTDDNLFYQCQNCGVSQSHSICFDCFEEKKHQGHNYYYKMGGFCCDCGDPTSFKPDGFCSRHSSNSKVKDLIMKLPVDIREKGLEIIFQLLKQIHFACAENADATQLPIFIDVIFNVFMVLNKFTKIFNSIIAEALLNVYPLMTKHKCICHKKEEETLEETHECKCSTFDLLFQDCCKKVCPVRMGYLAELSKVSNIFAEHCRKEIYFCYSLIITHSDKRDKTEKLNLLQSQIFNEDYHVAEVISNPYALYQVTNGILYSIKQCKENSEFVGIESVISDMHFFFKFPSIFTKLLNGTTLFQNFIKIYECAQFKDLKSSEEWIDFEDDKFDVHTLSSNDLLSYSFEDLMKLNYNISTEDLKKVCHIIYEIIHFQLKEVNVEQITSKRVYMLPLYNLFYQAVMKVVHRSIVNNTFPNCTSKMMDNSKLRELIIEYFGISSEEEYYEDTYKISQLCMNYIKFYTEIKGGKFAKPKQTMQRIESRMERFQFQLRRIIGLTQILFATNPKINTEAIFVDLLNANKDSEKVKDIQKCALYMIEQILCNDFINLYEIAYISIIKDIEIDPPKLAEFTDYNLKHYIMMDVACNDTKKLFKLDVNEIKGSIIFTIKNYKNIDQVIEALFVKKGDVTTLSQQSLQYLNIFDNINISSMLTTESNIGELKKSIMSEYFDPFQSTNYSTFPSVNIFKLINEMILLRSFSYKSFLVLLKELIKTNAEDDTCLIILLKILREYFYIQIAGDESQEIINLFGELKDILTHLKERNPIYSLSIDRIYQSITDYLSKSQNTVTVSIVEQPTAEDASQTNSKKKQEVAKLKESIMKKFKEQNAKLASTWIKSTEPETLPLEANEKECFVCKDKIETNTDQIDKVCGRLVSFIPSSMYENILKSTYSETDSKTLLDICPEYKFMTEHRSRYKFALACNGCAHYIHIKCYSKLRKPNDASDDLMTCPLCKQVFNTVIPFLNQNSYNCISSLFTGAVEMNNATFSLALLYYRLNIFSSGLVLRKVSTEGEMYLTLNNLKYWETHIDVIRDLKGMIMYALLEIGLLPFDQFCAEQGEILRQLFSILITVLKMKMKSFHDNWMENKKIISVLQLDIIQANHPLLVYNEMISAILEGRDFSSINYNLHIINFIQHSIRSASFQPDKVENELKIYLQKIVFLQYIMKISDTHVVPNILQSFGITSQLIEKEIANQGNYSIQCPINTNIPLLYLYGVDANFEKIFKKEYLKNCGSCMRFHGSKIICLICGKQFCSDYQNQQIRMHYKKCNNTFGVGMNIRSGVISYSAYNLVGKKKSFYINKYNSTIDNYLNQERHPVSTAMESYTLDANEKFKLYDIILNCKQLSYVNMKDESAAEFMNFLQQHNA